MRISRLAAKNYRTLEDLEVNFPTDYCTLSGHNNAGKSSIVRLLRYLLDQPSPVASELVLLNHATDRTQWLKTDDPIEVNYTLRLNRVDDSSILTFIKKYSNTQLEDEVVTCDISVIVEPSNRRTHELRIGTNKLTESDSNEVIRKLRSSDSLFLHNSTMTGDIFYMFRGGRFGTAYPIVLSAEERQQVSLAEQSIQKKIKKLTKVHKEELEGMIGKLKDKYDVEFSTTDSYASKAMPFDINLSDRSSQVPLDEWGSGTQNRTRILISVLQAKRVKTSGAEDRTTPIVVVEEPESFLHPTAQAEFGSLLQSLSAELQIQIIASTHSPYMLNQKDPSSNILLRRRVMYKKQMGSEIVDTQSDDWMAPFADHLGVIPKEFECWKSVFVRRDSLLLLVEGDTDKEYFEHLRKNHATRFSLPSNIEVVAYNGKDALKNVALLKFVLRKVESAFITFDLDCADEVRRPLTSIGLVEGKNFIPIGVSKPGRDAIEGLLPDKILSAVNGRETDLILQLGSAQRRQARGALKKKYLEEFKKTTSFTDAELEPLTKLARQISGNLPSASSTARSQSGLEGGRRKARKR